MTTPIAKYLDFAPPKLPIPCTPADLTPAMAAAMPAAMQGDFCVAYNLHASPWPEGLGCPAEHAFYEAMEHVQFGRGWQRMPDGSYQKEQADGTVIKAGKVLSGRNVASVRAARDALTALLVGAGEEQEAEAEDETEDDAELVSKADESMRSIAGWAGVAKIGEDVVADGEDDTIDVITLTKALHEYVAAGGVGKAEHGRASGGAVVTRCVEAVMVTPEFRKAIAEDPEHVGAWVKMQYTDTPAGEERWQRVLKRAKEEGKLPAFSIGGTAERVDL